MLIDLDPQSNLTTHLGIDPDSVVTSTYRVLTDGIPLAESLRRCRREWKSAGRAGDDGSCGGGSGVGFGREPGDAAAEDGGGGEV